jgi:hypothetical protein
MMEKIDDAFAKDDIPGMIRYFQLSVAIEDTLNEPASPSPQQEVSADDITQVRYFPPLARGTNPSLTHEDMTSIEALVPRPLTSDGPKSCGYDACRKRFSDGEEVLRFYHRKDGMSVLDNYHLPCGRNVMQQAEELDHMSIKLCRIEYRRSLIISRTE